MKDKLARVKKAVAAALGTLSGALVSVLVAGGSFDSATLGAVSALTVMSAVSTYLARNKLTVHELREAYVKAITEGVKRAD